MLKLNNPVSYTTEEQSTINSAMATGNSGTVMWNNAHLNTIKRKISLCTIREQGCRCAYCESPLMQGTTEIEHFVPKGLHREFTFEPLNLVSACGRCNSTRIKGKKETVQLPLNQAYKSNTFVIVHPRLDNPDLDIVFTDGTRTVFDKPKCTQKGRDTISFFRWDDKDAVFARLMNANMANYSMDIQQYALLVSTYK